MISAISELKQYLHVSKLNYDCAIYYWEDRRKHRY